MYASPGQRQRIEAAVREALETEPGENTPGKLQNLRVEIFERLYKLACQGHIPPELTLKVDVIEEPGSGLRVQYDRAFEDWYSGGK